MATRTTSANVRFEIQVSRALIDIATAETNSRCPVALSLKNAAADRIQRVKVDRNEISFSLVDHDIRYTFKTPARIQRFIDAFDTGGKVAPFKFVLETDKAIGHKAMAHPGAKATVYQAKYRARPSSEKKPRAVGRSARSVHAK